MGSGASLGCAESRTRAKIFPPAFFPIKTWSLPPGVGQSGGTLKHAPAGIYGTCQKLPDTGPPLNVPVVVLPWGPPYICRVGCGGA